MNSCFANGVAIQLMASGDPPRPAPWDSKISGYFPRAIGASSMARVPTKKCALPKCDRFAAGVGRIPNRDSEIDASFF